MATEDLASGDQQIVVFRLGGEAYGIDIFSVHEIIRVRDVTPIPRSAAHVRGLLNLRGKTIPVFDLKSRLEIGQLEETSIARIIVLDTHRGNVGVLVDEVREVMTIEQSQVEPAPALLDSVDTQYVRGVARHASGLIMLLDLDIALAA